MSAIISAIIVNYNAGELYALPTEPTETVAVAVACVVESGKYHLVRVAGADWSDLASQARCLVGFIDDVEQAARDSEKSYCFS